MKISWDYITLTRSRIISCLVWKPAISWTKNMQEDAVNYWNHSKIRSVTKSWINNSQAITLSLSLSLSLSLTYMSGIWKVACTAQGRSETRCPYLTAICVSHPSPTDKVTVWNKHRTKHYSMSLTGWQSGINTQKNGHIIQLIEKVKQNTCTVL